MVVDCITVCSYQAHQEEARRGAPADMREQATRYLGIGSKWIRNSATRYCCAGGWTDNKIKLSASKAKPDAAPGHRLQVDLQLGDPVRLFSKQNPPAASSQHISEAAGISVHARYSHFQKPMQHRSRFPCW